MSCWYGYAYFIAGLEVKCNGIQKFDMKSFIRINIINHFSLHAIAFFPRLTEMMSKSICLLTED